MQNEFLRGNIDYTIQNLKSTHKKKNCSMFSQIIIKYKYKMEILYYHLTSFGTSLRGTDSIIAGSFEDIFYCFFLPFLICFFTGGSSTATKIST